MIIHEDWENDKLNIYYREYRGPKCDYMEYKGDGDILVTERTEGLGQPMKPFIQLPLRFGKSLLALLNDEIANKGINQKKVDMQAGKTELLEKELAFNQSQLIKLIDHLTK